MLNLNKCTKTTSKPKLICKNCSCVCASLCTTVVHNTALNSSDNVPSHSPDNHNSSDDVYWRGGGHNLRHCPPGYRAIVDPPVLCNGFIYTPEYLICDVRFFTL